MGKNPNSRPILNPSQAQSQARKSVYPTSRTAILRITKSQVVGSFYLLTGRENNEKPGHPPPTFPAAGATPEHILWQATLSLQTAHQGVQENSHWLPPRPQGNFWSSCINNNLEKRKKKLILIQPLLWARPRSQHEISCLIWFNPPNSP